MIDKINSIFSVDFINELAKKSKFIQRKSKLTAVKFLDLMLFNSQFNHCLSLNQLAIEASSVYEMEITKQALDQRLNDRAVDFFKLLLQHQLSHQISQTIDANMLSSFNRVRIKDSTKFDVNSQLEDQFTGFGGSASSACANIQYEFDLKTGNCIDLSITPATENDSRDALNNKDDVQKGDLFIRDLGYYHSEVFKSISSKEAFYLSKLKHNIGVFEKKDGQYIELDFDKLYNRMTRNGIQTLEIKVYVGANIKMPTRLIVEIVPYEVYEKRLRKVAKERKKKGHKASKSYCSRARFNLIITNTTTEQLDIKAALLIYRLRWQVELVFKIWKSNFGINTKHKMNYERFMCTLISKLLVIMISWEIANAFRGEVYKSSNKLLSLNKCIKTLRNNSFKFREVLNKSTLTAERLIEWLIKIYSTKHWLEKRKNKILFEEIITLIF